MSNKRFQKFVVQFDNINFEDAKKCFRHETSIQYIGLYKSDTKYYLYVQNSYAMYESRIKSYINILGKYIGPSKFDYFEGECVESEGNYKKRGRDLNSKVVNGKVVKKKVKKKSIGINLTVNMDLKNKNTQKILPEEDHKRMAFFPIYTGYNRDWKIISWFPETKFVRKKTTQFRDILLEQQNNKCNYCKIDVNFGDYSNADVDHKIPLFCGGGSFIDNLQILCVMCHRYKTALETKSRTMSKSIGEMGF